MDLDTPIMYVKGVGPARAKMLESKGLHTVEDLLTYSPFRYEDRSNVKPIAQLAVGETATILAEVRSASAVGFQRKRMGLFEAVFKDGSSMGIVGKWFHGGYLADILTPGTRVALFGKIEFDGYSGSLQIMHPEFEILYADEDSDVAGLHTGRIVPVYEAAGKVTTRVMRGILWRVLENLAPLPDPMPSVVRERVQLPDRRQAVRDLHFPPPGSDLRLLNNFRSPAQQRMIFEEFFWLECGLTLKKNKARFQPGIGFELTDRVREQIKAMLPFRPTGAQKRVLKEIADDMHKPHPMYRLLQGDVGSGKTLVAAEAAIVAIENGYQVAVLAPTEILATQHYLYFKRLFENLRYEILLLTGSMSAKDKKTLKRLLAANLVPLAVGTHALLEDDVVFGKLGLAIVDEQHRFGVEQRLRLVAKGNPDVLVMTATPIPRTLALTMYGDLDVSIIDELPPGRKPIQTRHVMQDRIEQTWSFVKREIDAGRQAYVVYPLIEESETASMKAAQQMHEHLSSIVFPDLKVGLLHGKLAQSDKEAAMEAFKRGETDILVSTTVIEVGVDVPNASVMVIEQAERFGLSQLHQLRGRVGRGADQSYCILVTEKLGDIAKERIRTMVESTDGFYIAEMDLKLRGPGEFFGTKQSGLPVFRLGNIIRDKEILELARKEATEFVDHPPTPEELTRAVRYIQDHWQRRYGLVQVG